MTLPENFANFYATVLNGSIDDTDTVLSVDSAFGSPDVAFRLIIQDGEDDPTNREIVYVTEKAGENFTVERGMENTTAVAHADNSFVAHVITADGLTQAIFDRATNVVADAVLILDGLGGEIAADTQYDLIVDFNCTIISWAILADQTGSIVIDIWKDTYANFPPTDADSITGSTPPTLSADVKAFSDDTDGWTEVIDAGDVLRFNVDSADDVTRVTLILQLLRE